MSETATETTVQTEATMHQLNGNRVYGVKFRGKRNHAAPGIKFFLSKDQVREFTSQAGLKANILEYVAGEPIPERADYLWIVKAAGKRGQEAPPDKAFFSDETAFEYGESLGLSFERFKLPVG